MDIYSLIIKYAFDNGWSQDKLTEALVIAVGVEIHFDICLKGKIQDAAGAFYLERRDPVKHYGLRY